MQNLLGSRARLRIGARDTPTTGFVQSEMADAAMGQVCDVCVIGAGPVGLSTAIVLHDLGLSVAVVSSQTLEDMVSSSDDGRTFALSLSSYFFFEHLGLAGAMTNDLQVIRDVWVAATEKGDKRASTLRFFHDGERRDAKSSSRPFGFTVGEKALRAFLTQILAQRPSISVFAPYNVTYVTCPPIDPARVSCVPMAGAFACEITLRARLVVCAQGKHSMLPQQLGFKFLQHDYHQSALVGTFSHERDHEGIALENFGPDAALAVLPLPGRRSAVIWTQETHEAQEQFRLGGGDLSKKIASHVENRLGSIEPITRLWTYPLLLRVAYRLVRERFAMVGDVGHGIHPITAQGLNVGIRDVATLHDVLKEHIALGLDIGTLPSLALYEKQRFSDIFFTCLTTNSINAFFTSRLPLIPHLRRLGLRVADNLPSFKRLYTTVASGTHGDVSPLLQPLVAGEGLEPPTRGL